MHERTCSRQILFFSFVFFFCRMNLWPSPLKEVSLFSKAPRQTTRSSYRSCAAIGAYGVRCPRLFPDREPCLGRCFRRGAQRRKLAATRRQPSPTTSVAGGNWTVSSVLKASTVCAEQSRNSFSGRFCRRSELREPRAASAGFSTEPVRRGFPTEPSTVSGR